MSGKGGCTWNNEYSTTYKGFVAAIDGRKNYCYCTKCKKHISIFHKGKIDIETHISTAEHQNNIPKNVKTLVSYFGNILIQTNQVPCEILLQHLN